MDTTNSTAAVHPCLGNSCVPTMPSFFNSIRVRVSLPQSWPLRLPAQMGARYLRRNLLSWPCFSCGVLTKSLQGLVGHFPSLTRSVFQFSPATTTAGYPSEFTIFLLRININPNPDAPLLLSTVQPRCSVFEFNSKFSFLIFLASSRIVSRIQRRVVGSASYLTQTLIL